MVVNLITISWTVVIKLRTSEMMAVNFYGSSYFCSSVRWPFLTHCVARGFPIIMTQFADFWCRPACIRLPIVVVWVVMRRAVTNATIQNTTIAYTSQ